MKKIFTIVLMMLFAFSVNAQDLGKAPEIKHVKQNSVFIPKADQAAYTGNASTGTYHSIVLSDGTLTQTGTLVTDPFPMAEEFADGVVYRVDANMGFYSVNPDDGTTTSLGTITGFSGTPVGLAYDWGSSTMYLLVLDADNIPHLCTLDMNTYTATEIGAGTGMLIAMDFADDGYLYGPALDDENLYQIDPATGATTLIGSTGLGLNYGQDVSFDYTTGMLYTINCGDQYTYGTYDISTGAFTQIADMGGNQHATFVVCNYPVENGAPAAVSNYVVTPDAGGALTVDLSWTNPSLDFEGNALTELTSMDVYIDGSGTAAYTNSSPVIGGADSYTATVSTAGMHSFKVVGTNSAGEGMPTNVSVWVGEDVPEAPGNVVLTATDMDATVTWDAPAAGMHGGYFSGSGLTYTIVRQPGNTTVSADQTALTFTETLVDAGNYYYEVTASNTIGEGGTGTSNTLLFGDFLLYEDFEGTYPPAGWTEDETGGAAWGQNAGTVHPSGEPAHSGTMLAYFNSWSVSSGNTAALITPTIDFSNMNGVLSVWVYHETGYASSDDNIQVKMSIDDGSTWTDLGTPISRNDGTTGWAEHTFDIIGGGTATTKFNFFGTSAYGNDIHIDDVTLTGTSTIGVDNILGDGIKVFPNPSNGVFNINVDNNYNLEVFDITGRVINSRTLTGNTSIELNTAGVYFLRFSDKNGSYTQKVIVK